MGRPWPRPSGRWYAKCGHRAAADPNEAAVRTRHGERFLPSPTPASSLSAELSSAPWQPAARSRVTGSSSSDGREYAAWPRHSSSWRERRHARWPYARSACVWPKSASACPGRSQSACLPSSPRVPQMPRDCAPPRSRISPWPSSGPILVRPGKNACFERPLARHATRPARTGRSCSGLWGVHPTTGVNELSMRLHSWLTSFSTRRFQTIWSGESRVCHPTGGGASAAVVGPLSPPFNPPCSGHRHNPTGAPRRYHDWVRRRIRSSPLRGPPRRP